MKKQNFEKLTCGSCCGVSISAVIFIDFRNGSFTVK